MRLNHLFACLWISISFFPTFLEDAFMAYLLLLAPPLWSWPLSTGHRGQRVPLRRLDRLLCPPRAAGAGDLPRSLGCAPRPSGVHSPQFPCISICLGRAKCPWAHPQVPGQGLSSAGSQAGSLGTRSFLPFMTLTSLCVLDFRRGIVPDVCRLTAGWP